MRKSRFTAEQMAHEVAQVEAGLPLGEVCRKMGVSERSPPNHLPFCAELGQMERAVRLHAAVSALREEHGLSGATAFAHRCTAVEGMATGLSPAQHHAAWASGSVLDQDEAVTLALHDAGPEFTTGGARSRPS